MPPYGGASPPKSTKRKGVFLMKVSLQVVTRDEIVNKKRVVEYGEKTFDLDVSLACQMRWEAKFPEFAAKEDLINYAQ